MSTFHSLFATSTAGIFLILLLHHLGLECYGHRGGTGLKHLLVAVSVENELQSGESPLEMLLMFVLRLNCSIWVILHFLRILGLGGWKIASQKSKGRSSTIVLIFLPSILILNIWNVGLGILNHRPQKGGFVQSTSTDSWHFDITSCLFIREQAVSRLVLYL